MKRGSSPVEFRGKSLPGRGAAGAKVLGQEESARPGQGRESLLCV